VDVEELRLELGIVPLRLQNPLGVKRRKGKINMPLTEPHRDEGGLAVL